MNQGLLLVWQAARGWTIAWGILLLAQGLTPAAQIYLTKLTVDLLADTAEKQAGMAAFARVWLPVALIGLLWIVSQLLTSLVKWVRAAQAELVQDSIHSLIHDQALRLDVAFYENPESYDLLHRARVDAISQPIALLESFGTLIQNGLTLVVLAAMLASYTPWLPLLLIASALPGLWTVGRSVLRQHQWRIHNTANERRARYYDWLMTDRNSVAEMRLFDLGDYHQGLFKRLRKQLRLGRLGLARDEMKAELIAGAIAWLGGLAGMVWILLRMARGLAKLGDVVLCYQAFQQGQKLLRSLMESTGRIYRSILFLDNLFEFLAIEPDLRSKSNPQPAPVPLRKDVCFDGVTFYYPGSEHAALDNFSLTIPTGQMTAIVGHNGAGKSTLIKLLCRFYDPQKGCIRLDGLDLRDLDVVELRKQITVLFQEPVHYHATAAENIAMGDRAADPDARRIRDAAEAAGAAGIIERLPHGYETALGKWFGGAELSVGEWQRIALARSFLRNAAIIALDEPTSAMDSWAEADWLRRFRELTAGHTALAITHRFTTAMHADRIYVMVDGRIVESGVHKELVAAGGLYAASWRAQMKEVENA
ncbi:MAG TPA: ABC transporter ATP-binding protein [Kiritimatiellia bacterium]|nr:ABC transporter ATP-binding protein [Kiritimatiellia bacterium]